MHVGQIDKKLICEVMWFLILFIMLFTPYLIPKVLCPQDSMVFGYSNVIDDVYTLLAKMDTGYRGNILYSPRHSPNINNPAPVYMFYTILGNIARILKLDIVALYYFTRALLSTIAIFITYRFVKRFAHKYIILYLSIFVSSCLTIPGNIQLAKLNNDLAGHVLYNAMTSTPHYALDVMAYILLIAAYIDKKRIVPYSIISGLILGMLHPHLLAHILLILLIHGIICNKITDALKISCLASLASMVFMIPIALAFLNNQWLIEMRAQATGCYDNLTWVKSIYKATLGYGVCGVIAWYKLKDFKSSNITIKLCFVWMVLSLVLSTLLPTVNKYEFTWFMALPIAIISSKYVVKFANWIEDRLPITKNKMTRTLVLTIVIIACSTTTLSSVIKIINLDQNIVYIKKEVPELLNNLALQSNSDDIIVADPLLSLQAGFFVNKPRPYAAHYSETENYATRNKEAYYMVKQGIMIKNKKIRWIAVNKEIKCGIKKEPYLQTKNYRVWKLAGPNP